VQLLHVRSPPRVQVDPRRLETMCLRTTRKDRKQRRTRVGRVCYGKAVLANVSMGEGHDVRYAMTRKFFTGTCANMIVSEPRSEERGPTLPCLPGPRGIHRKIYAQWDRQFERLNG